jgi:hypothetical protein
MAVYALDLDFRFEEAAIIDRAARTGAQRKLPAALGESSALWRRSGGEGGIRTHDPDLAKVAIIRPSVLQWATSVSPASFDKLPAS